MLALSLAALPSCRVDETDLSRWETTQRGPEKLEAVLKHDKYETPLRVKAALSLIEMKARGGQRIGISLMIDTLVGVRAESRGPIVAALVERLITELKKPAAEGASGDDPSFPYKDAAFALLIEERTALVSDETLKKSLRAALVDWAMADFEKRLQSRGQRYGLEQVLRFIGPDAVRGLPKLMTHDAKRLDQLSALISDLGDQETKEEAGKALVGVATYVTSPAWIAAKAPEVKAANEISKLEPTEKQFKAQLAQYQDEDLFRIFGSMKKVGGRPSVEYCLAFAGDPNASVKRREAALAALEGRLDRNNRKDLETMLRLANSDAPDEVLDQVFRRLGELPRDLVVNHLYALFGTDKWKIRRAAAATVLKMSSQSDLPEFMARLAGARQNFAMPEALTYGASMAELKGADIRQTLKKYLATGSFQARASAAAFYYSFGSKADLATLKAHSTDLTPIPACTDEKDESCAWVCEVSQGTERVNRAVKTVGSFISDCVIPAAQHREPQKT